MRGTILIGSNSLFQLDNLVGIEVRERLDAVVKVAKLSKNYLQLWLGHAGTQFDITEKDAERVKYFLKNGYDGELHLKLEGICEEQE